jgi:hypothetical protein
MTWGDFKRTIDAALADLAGDQERIKFLNWDGNEAPQVRVREDRWGKPYVYIQ